MELINKWLKGRRNYYVGVSLFDQFGTDDRLKKYFSGTSDPIKKKKLETELQRIADKPGPILERSAGVGEHDSEMPVTDDLVLTALRAEWLSPYQRMKYLQAELDRYAGNTAADIKARHPIAVEILDLEQECMSIWARRDHYLEHGSLPDVKIDDVELPADPVRLAKLIDSTRKNIRRNKYMMRNNADQPKYALLVQKYSALLARINECKNE